MEKVDNILILKVEMIFIIDDEGILVVEGKINLGVEVMFDFVVIFDVVIIVDENGVFSFFVN